jgi:serine/threonine-protein kinase
VPPDTELPKIPGYEILKELGRGGMGVVYKARHVKLNRFVALKMILADELRLPHLLAFPGRRRDDRPLAIPISCRSIKWDSTGAGRSSSWNTSPAAPLAGMLKNGSLPQRPPFASSATGERASQYAHSQGIVHRDLKPANVLMQEDESQSSPLIPKITDFGLARAMCSCADLTSTGMVLGTPSYMASRPRLRAMWGRRPTFTHSA